MQDQDDCSWHPVFMLCEWTTGGGILRKKTLNPTFWKDKWHLVFFIIGCRATAISCSNGHLQYGDDNCQLFLCFACSRVRWTWTQHGPVCLRTSNVFESVQTAGEGIWHLHPFLPAILTSQVDGRTTLTHMFSVSCLYFFFFSISPALCFPGYAFVHFLLFSSSLISTPLSYPFVKAVGQNECLQLPLLFVSYYFISAQEHDVCNAYIYFSMFYSYTTHNIKYNFIQAPELF